ncbi:MAG: HipA N-terminal domain-containing protein [Sutterellaceae bacterium]|nr:HipA N-terminal domain-containing protein [Sutterellaceae bacterium]
MSGIDVGVFLGETEVGRLRLQRKAQQPLFEYADDWTRNGFAISPALPLTGQFDDGAALAFFQNMLPEGRGLDVLSHFAKVSKSNVLGLALAMRDDLVGAVRLKMTDAGQSDAEPSIRWIDKKELGKRLSSRDRTPIHVWDGKFRSTVAGA